MRFSLVRKLKDEVTLPSEEWKIAYLAGLVDGEGSITIRQDPHNSMVQLVVVNTHRGVLEWILAEFGGGSISSGYMSPKSTKPLYHMYYEARLEVLKMLRAIEPYLIIKKEKAIAAISLMEDVVAKSIAANELQAKVDQSKNGQRAAPAN